MLYELCMDCDYCDTDRKNEQGKVRCTRFSQYVDLKQLSCSAFCHKRENELYHILRQREGAE